METKAIIWALFTLPLAQTSYETDDPQSFNFLLRNKVAPYIEPSLGCLPPNTTAIKYTVKFHREILYFVCYDKDSNIPLQSKHLLSPPVSEHIVTTPHSSDKFSNDLTASPPEFYECSSQVENFKELLGSENLINCYGGLYFVPSNLVSASDFPFKQQREAAQYFINTFPQWKQIKDGNWKNLERSIRQYANQLGRSLMIRQGTVDVTTLPDNRGKQQPVYMTRNKANIPTVAVPRVVWKLVHDQPKFQSIVFVIVNNPYRVDTRDLFENNEVLCTCVCDETEGWFEGWDRKDFTQGYIYCCTWDEFHSSVGIDFLANTELMRRKT